MRWTYGNTHMIYTRNKIENTWAEWVQYATKSDLQYCLEFYQTNGLKDVTFQLFKYSDSNNKYILQVILNTNIFTKTINLAEFTI